MAEFTGRQQGLEHYEIGETLIEGRGGSFMVRGMNTDDLTFLITNYLQDMLDALAAFGREHNVSADNLLDTKALPELLMILTQGFPMLVAELISRCADRPGFVEVARRLPFPVQLSAIQAISKLTVEDAGGLGNLVAVLGTISESKGLRLGPLAKNLQTIIASAGQTSASSSTTDTPGPAATPLPA